jgi:plasmid replication initiation protein
MNEIIKYHNDINKLSFNGFNEKELNLFFSLCYKAQQNHNKEIELSFIELRTLSNGDIHLPRFLKTLKGVYDKLIKIPFYYHTDKGFGAFTLFNKYFVDTDKKTVTIRTSDEFLYILNDLIGNYTKFELENFVNLKSSYSKNMFKLLKQWETKKEKEFKVDELKDLLCVPTSYNNSKFNEKVLKPILTELPEFFPNFKMDKIKNGRKIISYKFTWGQKHQDINYVDDVEIEISEELQKAFEKASHNRFIQPFLTEDNKAELIEFFEDEKILIKGLIYAYKKIDKEFKRLSYLIKTITTGAEQQTKTIKVVKKEKENSLNEDDYIQTSFNDIISQSKLEEKERVLKEIYEDDFENLYKEYLKNNNADDTPYVRKCFAMPYKIIKREVKKVYTIEDIPEEKLIGKNGKKLVGGALKMRAKKILDEMNK